MKLLISFFIAASSFILTGCDALLMMTYSVDNQSKSEIQVHIPDFPILGYDDHFSQRIDTTLTLQPKQKVLVGCNIKIDFPWARKNIYKNIPGICGIQLIHSGLNVEIGCTKKEWKYRKGSSHLIIK